MEKEETEENHQLPFLDVLIDNGHSEFPVISVFRKKTYTGLLTNFFSFTPNSNKLGLISTLVDRAVKINNTWKGFNKDINQLTSILMKNCFPSDIIQRVVNNYLCKFFNHDNLPRDGQTKKGSTLFFKLPFIGPFSRATQRRIKVITKKYCKDLDIRLVFTSYKLKNMFVVKDAVPHSLWFTNFHAQAVALVLSARPPDIFSQGFGSIYFHIVTPIFTNI